MRAALLGAALLATACWDFDQALNTCTQPDHPCVPKDATGGGGGGGADGGPSGTWQSVYTLVDPAPLLAVHAVSKDEVWFSGLNNTVTQYLGGNFTEGYLTSVDVEAIGSDSQGVVFGGQWNGGRVTRIDAGITWPGGELNGANVDAYEIVYGIWNAGSKTLAAGKHGAVMESPGWTRRADSPNLALAGGGWGSADDNFWVFGVDGTNNGQLYHFNGTWQPPIAIPFLGGIWGVSPDDVWGSAEGFVIRAHSDGGVERFDAGSRTSWNGVWASGPNDVFFAGNDGVVAHFDGTRFTRTGVSTNSLYAIHGTGPLDVWAVDTDGGIWHYAAP